jgi:hypothetical protein
MIDALYGARFKVSAVDTSYFLTSLLMTNATWVQSWVGGQGITENIKYHDIRLYNVTYPIAVTQTYVDQNNPAGIESITVPSSSRTFPSKVRFFTYISDAFLSGGH